MGKAKQEYTFDGVNLRDASILDIGAGAGDFAEHAVDQGANRVVCLEPDAAGSGGWELTELQERADTHPEIEIREVFFQAFDTDEEFDVILLHNVINHLNEEQIRYVHTDKAAWNTFQGYVEKVRDYTRDGGDVVVADSARTSLWSRIGVERFPLGSVEFAIHQDPSCWTHMFESAGFERVRFDWTPVLEKGDLVERLTRNRLAAELRASHFCMVFRAT